MVTSVLCPLSDKTLFCAGPNCIRFFNDCPGGGGGGGGGGLWHGDQSLSLKLIRSSARRLLIAYMYM